MNFLGLLLPLMLGAYSIPLIIARLGVERFGTLTLVWAVVGYAGFLDFGISRALTKRIAEVGELAAIGRIVRPGLVLMFGIGIIAGLALGGGYFVADHLGVLRFDREVSNSVYLIAFSMPLVLVSLGQRGILEGRQRFGAANLARMVLGVATFGAPIPLLDVYPRLDVLVGALVAGRIAVLVIQGWACRVDLRAGWCSAYDSRELSALLHFGGWMTVSNLISPLMAYLDRFLIGSSSHAPTLAYYTTPFEVVTRLLIVPGAVTTALFPKLASWGPGNSSRAADGMVRGMGLNLMLLVPAVIGLQLFSIDLLEYWLGAEFALRGTLPMQLLAWGVLFNSLAAFPFAFLQSMGKPKWIALVHVAELPFYLLLLFALLRGWGIPGVAMAWLIRVAIDCAILTVLSSGYADAQQRQTVIQVLCFGILVGIIGLLTDAGYLQKGILWLLVSLVAVISGWRILTCGSLLRKQEGFAP